MVKPNNTTTTVTPTVTPTPTQGVVLVPTTKQTMVKRGNSSVPYPVSTVFITCINHLWVVQGGIWVRTSNPVNRGTLHNLCYGVGVCYHTTRTQVNRYLQLSGMGTIPPIHHWVPSNVQPQG